MNKVALYHCNTKEEIPNKIQKIVEDLGVEKVSNLFRNKKVLLKPNLCVDHFPEKGATTNPAVLEAVIRIAKDFGAEVLVGDGAAVGIRARVELNTGVGEICKKYNVKFIDFNREEGKIIKVPKATALKEVLVAKTFFEIDTLVNLPVMKTHIIYWVSGALKNMKGLLVGIEKHKPHYLGVDKCLADINKVLKQDLIIMDGFVGMMGDGPVGGKPANARLLIGGFNPVEIDILASKLMGLPVERVPMIKYAVAAGIGTTEFELVGDPLNSFRLNFEKPLVAQNKIRANIITSQLLLFFNMARNSKMVVDQEKCKLCMRCQEMCPFHAIYQEKGKVHIKHGSCKFCFCCTEVCKNEAIKLKGVLSLKEQIAKS